MSQRIVLAVVLLAACGGAAAVAPDGGGEPHGDGGPHDAGGDLGAPPGAVLLKRDTFTEDADTALPAHTSDVGTTWIGGDTASFVVVAGGGVARNTTPDRRVALGAETVTTEFQVAEVTGQTMTGELGVVCAWRGDAAGGSGYLLVVDAGGFVRLLAFSSGAIDELLTGTIEGWSDSAEHTLRLVYEPEGNGHALVAGYVDGELAPTDDGPHSFYRHVSVRQGESGAPGIYARGEAARVAEAALYSTDGLRDGLYTWPNITLPYRVVMDRNTQSGSSSINAIVTSDRTIGGRDRSLVIDLSDKPAGVEGAAGSGMGQSGEWNAINGQPARVSIRWQQYLGTTLNALRGFKQHIVIGDAPERRGAVIVNFTLDGTVRDIGIGIPGGVNYGGGVVLGEWQEYEAVYDYAGQLAELHRHDGGAGVISTYSLAGFDDATIAYPEGIGWYWDDEHGAATDDNTFEAIREVTFAADYQGPSPTP